MPARHLLIAGKLASTSRGQLLQLAGARDRMSVVWMTRADDREPAANLTVRLHLGEDGRPRFVLVQVGCVPENVQAVLRAGKRYVDAVRALRRHVSLEPYYTWAVAYLQEPDRAGRRVRRATVTDKRDDGYLEFAALYDINCP